MKKLLITTTLLFTALPFTFDGVTPTVSKAHAIIGRPLTPFSFAGAHRRAMRRTYGLGWRGGVGYGRFGYGYGFRHPVAAAAIYRRRHFGYGYHPIARAYDFRRPLYAYAGAAPGWGGGWGGWGWNRPFLDVGLGFGGGGWGWGGGWGGWGRRWW